MPDGQAAVTSALKFNTASIYMMKRVDDPVFQAQQLYNQQNAGQAPLSEIEPNDDTRAYPITGAPAPLSRPFLRVQQLGLPLPGPAVRFQRQDDGLHLKVTFEEDFSKRPANAVPFNVTARSVQLRYGNAADQILAFDTLLQEPLPATTPPSAAFTIVADAKVPDDRVDVIVRAMRTGPAASWVITMDFPWVQLVPGVAAAPEVPAGVQPLAFQQSLTMQLARQPQPAPAIKQIPVNREVLMNPNDWMRVVLKNPTPPPPVRVTKTITIVRQLDADYPTETSRNRPIYAEVLNDYAQVPWSNSASGYYLPTPIQDTIYCVPDAYRLEVDPLTGRPAIQMTLLKGDQDDDPRNYKIRFTMLVKPDFDPVRLDALRTLMRREFLIQFADLTMGGYKSASFKADEALSGIGEMFAGHSAEDKSLIDPINGFSLTYEGRTEFIDDLTERLKSTGIGGQVILQLDQPGEQDLSLPIPVLLTLRQMAAVDLAARFSAVLANGKAEEGLPRAFQVSNQTTLPIKVAAIQIHALQKSPLVGAVKDWCGAAQSGASLPAVIPPDGKIDVVFTPEKPDVLFNAWSVQLVGVTPAENEKFLLDLLLDHATQGVRGWKVELDCPPLQFFDQLTAEQQAPIKDVVACEVQVKRKLVNAATGELLDTSVESARLTRAAPGASVLLSRTISDFVSDRAGGNNIFLMRRRLVRILSADEWNQWQEGTGEHASVFFN